MTEIVLDVPVEETPVVDLAGSGAAQTTVGTLPPSAASAPSTATQTTGGIAEFEKAQVASTVTKISGSTAVDSFGNAVSLDDRVRAVGEFRVTGVRHYVAKDGSVVREQILAPCGDLTLVPWNPSNPNDIGILRARP